MTNDLSSHQPLCLIMIVLAASFLEFPSSFCDVWLMLTILGDVTPGHLLWAAFLGVQVG